MPSVQQCQRVHVHLCDDLLANFAIDVMLMNMTGGRGRGECDGWNLRERRLRP